MTRPSDPDAVVEALLVLRAQAGDRRAFARLAEGWQERLWRHVFRLTGRSESAHDAVQEVWVAVARSIRGLADPQAFRAWIYRIATRKAADQLRARGRATSTESMDAFPAVDLAVADERDAAVRELRAALERLPGDLRALIALHHLDGIALAELAEIFEVPVGTVKSRLHRARGQLRSLLERTDDEPVP